MSIDLTGITNRNEYYTNHYFATLFEESAKASLAQWKEGEDRTPWAQLRQAARQFYQHHDRYGRSGLNLQNLCSIRTMADRYLAALGYPEAMPENIVLDDLTIPVYLEVKKSSGAPLLWVILAAAREEDAGIMESFPWASGDVDEDASGALGAGILGQLSCEELANKILFGTAEPPRFVLLVGMNQIALIDRNKWNEKRYLQFELEEIFSRLENTTLQAMTVLLHRDSLCPEDGKVLLDELDEQSQRNASGVSQDLKYALRESIELLGNEVLYDLSHRQGRDLEADPVDAGQLTLECLRYMYRMLFVLFIESRPELGYAPIKAQSYYRGYSLESLRDIADSIRDDVDEVGNGYYLHETLAKLYELIYNGYPKTEDELKTLAESGSLHDIFLIAPLKAHIFDPEYTKMITAAKLRNSCMLRIIDLMSLTRATGKKNSRRGRISYANLGINQMGAVYEALLSYRGFIAEHDLYEVKRKGDTFNELDVGYFVPESELDQYDEDERVRYEHGEKKGKLRMYEKGTFIYRLAGREREKSASYYTPEVLTKCLVKYALKELLAEKSADEILHLTICEPAMGSAAFLNEAINQLAEAYITRKEQETGEIISYEKRFSELQKVKMYIADRNVYGIDLNPVAVELAEVSLWLNTIYEGGFVPWFGTQLINGNSLIGARRQVYSEMNLTATSKGLRWYENAPDRVPVGKKRSRKSRKGAEHLGKYDRKMDAQIYHFLLGDPGMCSYSDKVIKSLEPDNIKKMSAWNKKFIAPYAEDELQTLERLSDAIDSLWEQQVQLRKKVEAKTRDSLSVFGHADSAEDSRTTIRQKDRILSEIYKSEHMQNAGPYARLKFAMDYWCALWFWPIDKADLLPSRNEFFFDMSMILEGTMAAVNVSAGQMSLFGATEMEQLSMDLIDIYGTDTIVDIPRLRKENPRLDLVARIAEQNKFMHWELEFADLFQERGGFDLVVGNPPWIKMEWNEQNALSDEQPLLAVKDYTAAKTASIRTQILENEVVYSAFLKEYVYMSGNQCFMNAFCNYYDLRGQQTNLYKCFIPQGFTFANALGCIAFVHPNSIFDDPKGEPLRSVVYKRLFAHYRFENELKLFQDVGNAMKFSLNLYCNKPSSGFDAIFNIFDPRSIDDCYVAQSMPVEGIKDQNGHWSVHGHPDRVLKITKKELNMFSLLFDNNSNGVAPKLPVLHTVQYLKVLDAISRQTNTIFTNHETISTTEMWHETNSQNDGTIIRNVHFPDDMIDTIFSGPHINVGNPLFQASQRDCKTHRAYDLIDLTAISSSYIQRCNYSVKCDISEYQSRIPITTWGAKWNSQYHIIARKMQNLSGERTLVAAIVPPKTGHIHGCVGFAFKDIKDMVSSAGAWASVPYDFLAKVIGKQNLNMDSSSAFPILTDGTLRSAIILRALKLNCITENYSDLVNHFASEDLSFDEWSKNDPRLKSSHIAWQKNGMRVSPS